MPKHQKPRRIKQPESHANSFRLKKDIRKRIQRILSRNRKIFLAYNEGRKEMFTGLSEKESEALLYLLPWLLCVNEPECPGYVPNQAVSFRVSNIEDQIEIRKREPGFKRLFNLQRRGSLLKHKGTSYLIQGLYSIGSIGSVSQNSSSDCDIWICFDKQGFDKKAWGILTRKVNLIKDWLDANLKIPVYFFVSEVSDIRECRFGGLDQESSGTAQQNVLKEEFYRSCLVICGKLPLWWLCWDEAIEFSYHDALAAMEADDFWEYDLIDFGDVRRIEKNEYFGAALWQLNKSLSRPLKSFIKMNLLKIQLDSSDEQLMCHLFRKQVLSAKPKQGFPDFSVFTMGRIAEWYKERTPALLAFCMECMYMACDVKPFNRKQKLKNQLAQPFFRKYGLDRERQNFLRKFDSWHYHSQIELGGNLFRLLIQIYKEISEDHAGVISESDRKDLTILGRKISAAYVEKERKIPLIFKPSGTLNISKLSIRLYDDVWHVFSGNDIFNPIASSRDIVHNVAVVVWNNLFHENVISMSPNPSSITLQEIINIGSKIKDFFGTHESQDIDYAYFLRTERIHKLMIIAGLETPVWYEKDGIRFGTVYMNQWGELFARRFDRSHDFDRFIDRLNKGVEVTCYIMRSTAAYEKIIARTKQRLGIRAKVRP